MSKRAERRERQASENRDRVDEALVEHAENDVDHEDRQGQEQQQSLRRLLRTPAAVPAKLVGDGRRQRLCGVFCTSATAVPSEIPGRRLNEIVTDGQLAGVVHRDRAEVGDEAGNGDERASTGPLRRAHVERIEGR